MKANANGISINYQIEGKDGAPWVTLAHSLGANLTMWDDQVAALEDDYRILRMDTRGHGATEATGGAYDFNLLGADITSLWDVLEIGHSHLVGLSLGGMTAMGMALRLSGRLDSITVCSARADAPVAMCKLWDERIAQIEAEGMAPMVEGTLMRWFTPDFVASGSTVLDQVREMIRTTKPAGYIGCARAIQGLDFLPRLGEITVPTLFIAGAGDGAAPAEGMQVMHAAVKGSQYVELSPASHISNLEQPQAYNDAVMGFLASI
ncbi:MAG: 3-oxoadipate enol-lactonase [Alphaproteobacteria bacterium]